MISGHFFGHARHDKPYMTKKMTKKRMTDFIRNALTPFTLFVLTQNTIFVATVGEDKISSLL
jgi:hypothetical protein